MKNFFVEILKKLITTILFAVLMFVASYCIVTGEFPPKIANLKNGVANLQAQVKQINKIREHQLAKLAAAADNADVNHGATQAHDSVLESAELKYQQALLDKIKELEARIARLENQSR